MIIVKLIIVILMSLLCGFVSFKFGCKLGDYLRKKIRKGKVNKHDDIV